MSNTKKVAQEVMALVDEFPSEPFSFERRRIEDLIYLAICKYTQESGDELDNAFALGIDEGTNRGYEEAKEEFEQRIQELEAKIQEIEEDMQQKIDDATAEGYEAARIEYGVN